MFADLGDRISLARAASAGVILGGPEASGVPLGNTNSVLRAAALMGVPVTIRLDKHLPAAAGIGGGSADAAAVLRGIADLTGRPLPLDAASLGADVPVCLISRAARMRGIGEVVEPVDLPALHAVLVNPRRAVATGAVFAALRDPDNPAMPEVLPVLRRAADLIGWLAGQRNDLEPAAMALEPSVGAVLAALRAQGDCRLARMSGSGATCFGLCDNKRAAERMAAALAAAQPGWWVRAVRLS